MAPSSMRAVRRASSGFMPWRIFSSASRSTYPRTSASSSRSFRRLPKVFRKKLVIRESMGMMCPPNAMCLASFVPQRAHGVDAHRPVRWDIRGDQPQRDYDRTAKHNGDGTLGRQVADETGEHASCPKHQRCSEGQARANRPQRIAQYHAHYIASRRAERAERCGKHGNQPLWNDRRIDLLVHRHNPNDGNILQHGALDLPSRAGNPVGIDFRADGQLRVLRTGVALLKKVRIDRRRSDLLEIVVFGVADDADHLKGLFPFRHRDMVQSDVSSDGVFVPEAIAGYGLVNDSDMGAVLVTC